MMKGSVIFLVATHCICHALNFSAQLLEGLQPDDMTSKQWAGVADQMISKTSGRAGLQV